MSLLVTTPVIAPPRPGLVESWAHRPHLIVVNGWADGWERVANEWGLWAVVLRDGDGRSVNAGCPVSWNLAFQVALDQGYDYVAITSQGLVLRDGTAALAAAVAAHADRRGMQLAGSFQKWHCLTIATRVWRRIGRFDERLPMYCDCDFAYRCRLGGIWLEHSPAVSLPFVDRRRTAVRAGAVDRAEYDRDLARYVAKWGGEPYAETLTTPAGR